MNTYTTMAITDSIVDSSTFQKFNKRSKHTSEHEQDNKRYSKQSYKHQRQVKRSWEGE